MSELRRGGGAPRRNGSGYPGHRQLTQNMENLYLECMEELEETAISAYVSPSGVITVLLRYGIKVDLTVNKAIRIWDKKNDTIVALSSDGEFAAMKHPSGSVYQYGSRVEVSVPTVGGSAYAKMWCKGVSFTNEKYACVYYLDETGTRKTFDKFSDLSGDFTIPVFLNEESFGPKTINDCIRTLQNASYSLEDDVERWYIKDIKISQAADGFVRVYRGSTFQITTSPLNGTTRLSSPFVHTTASKRMPGLSLNMNPSHLFVKKDDKRVHFNGVIFNVYKAGLSSGFDKYLNLKEY